MSKKNSNVNLRFNFENSEKILQIYLDFKKKIRNLKNKSFVVAISGGADSLALAALTKLLSQENNYKFYFVLINHNIRKESFSEANQVKKLLKKKNINLIIINNKVKIFRNIQGEARNIRYELLVNFCLKKNIKTILTAHNLEDQVETFFIRLSRGSGLSGLSAMKPTTNLHKKVILYRPLLNIKKKYLIKISKISFGRYFKDPSNKNPKFLRTKIRRLKRPLEHSGIEYDQIIKSINNLASSKSILENYFSKIFKDLIKKKGDEIMIDKKKFNVFNNEIKMNIINKSIKKLKKNYYDPRSKKVLNLILSLKRKNFKKSTLGGCLFTIKKDQICLKKEKN
tara:strand:- start:1009 stop:2028 length:1020 start_codon:yes stop_codon:yes gene_type:complete